MASARKYVYCIFLYSYYLYGWFIASLGPLIPHFSAVTLLDETHYSYLFIVRTAANIAGGFAIKFMLRQFKINTIINAILGCLAIGFFLASLSLSTANLIFTIFLVSLAFVGEMVVLFDVTYRMFADDKPDYWTLLLGFFFGVGAMCGPFWVALLGLSTFKVLSLMHLVALLLILKFPIPESSASVETDNAEKVQQIVQKPELGKSSVLFISLIFFFFASVELGEASWISTYSIKAGVADVESSAIYCLLFWIPNCFCRLFWMYIPGSVQYRLGLSIKLSAMSAGIVLLLQWGEYYQAVCIFGPLALGSFVSGVFGLGMALPADQGFQVSPQNSANFILGNSFGEGMLIMPLGYIMQIFGYKSLTICIFLLGGLFYWSFKRSVEQMEKDRKMFQEGLLSGTELK